MQLHKIATMTLGALISTSAFAERSEDLLGYVTTPQSITIQVASGGCTTKESFDIVLEDHGPDSIGTIEFIRTQPDRCRANFPHGVLLTFDWDSLGVSSFSRVVNTVREITIPRL